MRVEYLGLMFVIISILGIYSIESHPRFIDGVYKYENFTVYSNGTIEFDTLNQTALNQTVRIVCSPTTLSLSCNYDTMDCESYKAKLLASWIEIVDYNKINLYCKYGGDNLKRLDINLDNSFHLIPTDEWEEMTKPETREPEPMEVTIDYGVDFGW